MLFAYGGGLQFEQLFFLPNFSSLDSEFSSFFVAMLWQFFLSLRGRDRMFQGPFFAGGDYPHPHSLAEYLRYHLKLRNKLSKMKRSEYEARPVLHRVREHNMMSRTAEFHFESSIIILVQSHPLQFTMMHHDQSQ